MIVGTGMVIRMEDHDRRSLAQMNFFSNDYWLACA